MDFNTEIKIINEIEITEKEAYNLLNIFNEETKTECTINKIQIGEMLRILKIKLLLEE